MAFGITVSTSWPAPADDGFPNYIQFQNQGTDLGGPDATIVDFSTNLTATRGVGEDANKITVSASGGGGGGGAPTFYALLNGSSSGTFDGSDFSTWESGGGQDTTDLVWNSDTNSIDVQTAGIYEVTVTIKIGTPSDVWPSGNSPAQWSLTGSTVPGAIAAARSVHHRSVTGTGDDSHPGSMQFSDTYLYDATVLPESIPIKAYAKCYGGGGFTAYFTAVVFARRISP